MLSLADRGGNPSVVNDQFGRLTFTTELARAVRHLIDTNAPYGTYNVTGAGAPMSWADVARQVFALAGHAPDRVTSVTSKEYFADSSDRFAPRPRFSVLDLTKIESTGFVPVKADQTLVQYILQATHTTQKYES
jgi:dTDP-4-dehydrorhamnose 3,5-epimerase